MSTLRADCASPGIIQEYSKALTDFNGLQPSRLERMEGFGHGSGTAKAECRSAPCRMDAADCRMQEQRNKREEVVPGKRRVRENLLLLAKANLFLNCIAHFPPPAARDRKPNQVQCCTWLKTAREQLSPGRFSPCCIDPGNSHSRGPLAALCDSRRSACLFPPPAAAGSGPTGRGYLT